MVCLPGPDVCGHLMSVGGECIGFGPNSADRGVRGLCLRYAAFRADWGVGTVTPRRRSDNSDQSLAVCVTSAHHLGGRVRRPRRRSLRPGEKLPGLQAVVLWADLPLRLVAQANSSRG